MALLVPSSAGTNQAGWNRAVADTLNGLVRKRLVETTISAATTLTDDYDVYLCDASGAAFTVTLPKAGLYSGKLYYLKKIDSSANAITIDADGSETIDGAATQSIENQYQTITLFSDGTGWNVVPISPTLGAVSVTNALTFASSGGAAAGTTFDGSAAQGDLLFRGASGWQRLAAGTSGQFLKTLGSGADPAWDTAGGGSGGGPCPAIRSTSIQANASAASYTVTFPTGAAAGDFCIIFHGGGFGGASITSPSTALWATYQQGATNWGGSIFTRRLTAADITAGSVTITPTGSFNSVAACVVFTGDAQLRFPQIENAARTIAVHAPGTGATSSTQTTPYVSSDDCVLAFLSNRAASNDTSSYGASLQTVNAANGSGALYANEAPSAGGQSTTFSYSTAGTGRFELLLAVRGPS
jgi:hypothetical protein